MRVNKKCKLNFISAMPDKSEAICRYFLFRFFTLIELLTITAIIMILISILLPALKIARKRVHISLCSSNLKQVNLGFEFYGNDYNGWSPSLQEDPFTEETLWSGKIYLYIYPGPLPSVSGHPPYLYRLMRGTVFNCPERNDTGNSANPAWRISYGYNYMFAPQGTGSGSTTKPLNRKANKKPSSTSMVVDFWCHAADAGTYIYSAYANEPFRHLNGRNVLFADGHVKWLKDTDIPISNHNNVYWDGT